MRMYRCDRCGRYVERGDLWDLSAPRWVPWRLGSKRHLCDRCVDEFRRWWDEKEEVRRKRLAHARARIGAKGDE